MEVDRCARCKKPYSVADVEGHGILRARPAAAGGPFVEYRCAHCGRLVELLHHGSGRYARRGQPPPRRAPTQAERTPAWVDALDRDEQARTDREHDGATSTGSQHEASSRQEPASHEHHWGSRSADQTDADLPPIELVIDDNPLSIEEARELLGVETLARKRDVERAFRERSRTCHPDKVAHLDPDFARLAEQKFRRLVRAYEMVLRVSPK